MYSVLQTVMKFIKVIQAEKYLTHKVQTAAVQR